MPGQQAACHLISTLLVTALGAKAGMELRFAPSPRMCVLTSSMLLHLISEVDFLSDPGSS